MPSAIYSAGTSGPSFALPPGACDCHMHVLDDRQKMVPEAVLKHPAASLADYATVQRRLGSTRFVVVQPSLYGLDNGVLIQALAQSDGQARGVAVIDDQTPRQEVERLHTAGVRGVRFNLVQRGATTLEMLRPVAELVSDYGWHIQVHMRASELGERESLLSALPVPVVVDHLGRVAEEPSVRDAAHACLRRMLDGGRIWMKLSAPYLASARADFSDIAPLVSDYLRFHHDRLVWASDWPHATESSKPDDAVMMDFLLSEAPVPVRAKILVDIPARMYDFPAP